MSQNKIKSVTVPTWQASITMGRNLGYSNQQLSFEEIMETCSKIQHEIATHSNIKLSTKLTACTIVFMGQKEPSVSIEFIQYPKFLYDVTALKAAIVQFSKLLITHFEQNRLVIVFPDETIMLEVNDEIDTKIKV